MRSRIRTTGIAAILLSGGIWLTGCQKSDEPVASAAAAQAPQALPGAAKPQAAAGVPDETVYPAPPGLKTGVLDGGAARRQ